jgi:hypothetical protein
MIRWMQSSSVAFIVATGLLTIVSTALAQNDSLGAARELYVAAAYEDALVMLNGLRGSDRREEKSLVERYRAFCLLALGRAREADSAIEAAVAAAPLVQPSEAEVSPSIRSTFREVRRSALPAIIERQYAEAKAAFDRKDPTAAERFTQVVQLIDDADLERIANQPPLSQLRVMATDFLLLSAPKPSPPPAQLRAAQAPAGAPLLPPAAPRDAAQIYGPDDPNVTPPALVRQSFAALSDVFSPRPGAVEIVVDETGAVIAVMTKVSVNALYDRLALATAKTWRYRPAVRDGVAVKFRMIVLLQQPSKH